MARKKSRRPYEVPLQGTLVVCKGISQSTKRSGLYPQGFGVLSESSFGIHGAMKGHPGEYVGYPCKGYELRFTTEQPMTRGGLTALKAFM